MIVLFYYLVVLILCKSLTGDEGCKLALCYMPYVWMNEWMNEWIMNLYSALLCIAVHPKRFTIMCVGGGLSSTTTSV